jgi:RNA recognition motif-containing protein
MPWLDKSEPVYFKSVDDEFDFIPAIKRKSFKAPSFVRGGMAPTPFPAGRRTLMAKNLPRESITVAKLRKVFEPFGTLKDVFIPLNMDKSSPYFKTVKGFAKIEFLTAESATAAYNKLFGSLTIDDCLIGLEPAKEDRI